MGSRIHIKLLIGEEQRAALEAFAAKHYKPDLKITWQDVASAWAKTAFDNYMREHMERMEHRENYDQESHSG